MKPVQLNLFQECEISQTDEKITKAANEILSALNDGRKVKYEPHYYFQEGGLIVLMAVNKHKESVFNILDFEGKTPDGLSSCWRSVQHIKHDLATISIKDQTNKQTI